MLWRTKRWIICYHILLKNKKTIISELKYLLKFYLFRNSLIELIKWFNKKLKKRIFVFSSRYNSKYYPKKITKFINDEIGMVKPNLIDANNTSNENINLPIPKKIPVISKNISLSNNRINWKIIFDDPEYYESIHRWNWLTVLASGSKKINEDWIINIQEDWIDLFQDEIHLKKYKLNKLIHWESYTVGERISNSILVYKKYKIIPSQKIQQAIIDQVSLLITRLEYFGDYTGNHIINNARAIYFAGEFFGCKEWEYFAELIIKNELPKLVSIDGFLREGSSHYQFLFSRWIIELLSISKNDSFKKYLKSHINRLLSKCNFFLIQSKSKASFFPLFGDISPDFSPLWLANITYNSKNLPMYSWNRILPYEKTSELIGYSNIDKFHDDKDYSFPNSGWYRFNFQKYILFIHNDPKESINHVGHSHNDAGHFCLYYNKMPLFIDTGRMDYKNTLGACAKSHNTITLNDYGVNPDDSKRFPKEYRENNSSLNYNRSKDNLNINFESDGFDRIKKGILWNRKLNFNKKSFTIEDIIKGTGEFILKSYFHFGQQVIIKKQKPNIYILELDGKKALFNCDLGNEKNGRIFSENKSNNLGWQVIEYDRREPIYTLEITKKVSLPLKINYELIWV